MCGRYTLATPAMAALRSRFPLGDTVELRRRFNVCPGDDVATVTTSREGEPRGELLCWGLLPHWATDASTGFKMINARAETITEKPAYRDAFRTRRAYIVLLHYFQHRRSGHAHADGGIAISDCDSRKEGHTQIVDRILPDRDIFNRRHPRGAERHAADIQYDQQRHDAQPK